MKQISDSTGSPVRFDRRGDGLARYDILNYQKLTNSTGYHYRVRDKVANAPDLRIL